MNKKFICGMALAAVVTSSLIASAAGFEKKNTYTDGQFTDIPSSEWYAGEVKSTYELGLMNGIGGGLFNPEGNVTVAEAITMATRAASIYTGETIAAADGEWYQKYINFAVSKGFITENQFDDFDRPAKRFEVASIFENAMPDGYFTVKNDVKEIPDVDASLAYREDLLTLYKAGVVMGSDSYGNFRPEDNITRAEAAAIITRVALPENRLSKSLDVISNDDAYTLVYNTSYAGNKEGINSGWRLDNRGGVPRTSIEGGYGALTDISKTDGTAMIREFNKITSGVIDLESTVDISGSFNGFCLEFRNEADETVYKIITDENVWKIENPDGSVTKISDKAAGKSYTFNISIDIDNRRSTTVINGINCGTYPLCVTGDAANLMNFRFATTKESTAVAALGPINMTANYAVNDDFDFHKNDGVPFEWTGYNAENKSGELVLYKNGYVSRAFNPVSGTVVSRFETKLDKGQSLTYEMKSGAKTVVKFTSDDKNLYANGVKVYENYVQNLWYRFSVDVRTLDGKADIWLNGRKVAVVDLAEKTTSIDNISFANASEDGVSIERVKVFKKIKHDDYVPVPVKPKGEEKHTVGINICSLWRNGTHFGWSCISAYDDTELVLGYYDEGVPETADWEIKYMVEHGIDFQAFCWFADNIDSAIKNPANSEQLYNGYMYSEYSDMMKYCIIWEVANAAKPSKVEYFKEYYAPYFIENFFKDERYMTIDNKPVVCMFGASSFASLIGGEEKVKECFDYLEEEAKKLGFDGVIYLSCGSSSNALANMGFDGCYAYSWSTAGYDLDVNKNSILNSAKNTAIYTVPTISVGFNSIPWHGIRYPLMKPSDFEAGHKWVVEEYLPKHAKEEWQKNFSMISTWNEYGEGTYIMPSAGNGGFGYLDALRSVYTDEEPDESLNTVPTEKQRERINHLYPQYRKLLRKQGNYNPDEGSAKLVESRVFDFANADIKVDGTTGEFVTDTFKGRIAETKGSFTAEGLKGTVNGDTRIYLSDINMKAEESSHLKLEIQAQKGTNIDLFFVTESDKSWTHGKRYSFKTDSDGLKEYTFKMGDVSGWNGKITQIRIDPGESERGVTGNSYIIKKATFLKDTSKVSRIIRIDGNEYKMNIKPEVSENGDYLVAFEPVIAMDYALNCFYTWDASAKKLILEFADHTVIFTVGSDKYLLDGKEKPLGYTMYLIDGLPVIPLNKLCEDIGYECTVNENSEASVVTSLKEYYDKKASRIPGIWEFNTPGDVEGWSSNHMSLITVDGTMTMATTGEMNDPVMSYAGDINLTAEQFDKFEIKCRYKYNSDVPQTLTIYFTTDTVPSYKEFTTIKAKLESNDTYDEWKTYTVDLTKIPDWKGTIKRLRFDPFNATGTMEIDYMKFIEKEGYVPVVKEPEKFGIFGDGNSGVGNFFSENAEITIVPDPDDETNMVFNVEAKKDKKYWTYFRYKTDYKAGQTYKIAFDVKATAVGENKDSSASVSIQLNMRYFDANNKADHIAGRVKAVVGGEWVHYETEFTVPSDSRRGTDQFTIYAEPIGEQSISYMLDNISVTEVE